MPTLAFTRSPVVIAVDVWVSRTNTRIGLLARQRAAKCVDVRAGDAACGWHANQGRQRRNRPGRCRQSLRDQRAVHIGGLIAKGDLIPEAASFRLITFDNGRHNNRAAVLKESNLSTGELRTGINGCCAERVIHR